MSTLQTTEEKPGWIWILHISEFKPDEEDDDSYALNTVGAFATKDLLIEAAQKMGLKNFGVMHILVEGANATK